VRPKLSESTSIDRLTFCAKKPTELFVITVCYPALVDFSHTFPEGLLSLSRDSTAVESRDMVMRSLVRAVYRFRDATLVAEKKDDFGNALQNLYRELERAEDLVGPAG